MTDNETGLSFHEAAFKRFIDEFHQYYLDTPYVIVGASGLVPIYSAGDAAESEYAVAMDPRKAVQCMLRDDPREIYRVARLAVYGTPETYTHLVGWFSHQSNDMDEKAPLGPNLSEALAECMPMINLLNSAYGQTPDQPVEPWAGGTLDEFSSWVIKYLVTPKCIERVSAEFTLPDGGRMLGSALFRSRQDELVAARIGKGKKRPYYIM